METQHARIVSANSILPDELFDEAFYAVNPFPLGI